MSRAELHDAMADAVQHDAIVGVVVIGRAKAWRLDLDDYTAEVTRLCTDGTRNACSMLYGAARRRVAC